MQLVYWEFPRSGSLDEVKEYHRASEVLKCSEFKKFQIYVGHYKIDKINHNASHPYWTVLGILLEIISSKFHVKYLHHPQIISF